MEDFLLTGFIGKKTKHSPREGTTKYAGLISLLERLERLDDKEKVVTFQHLTEQQYKRIHSSLYCNTIPFVKMRKFLADKGRRFSVWHFEETVPYKFTLEISIVPEKSRIVQETGGF